MRYEHCNDCSNSNKNENFENSRRIAKAINDLVGYLMNSKSAPNIDKVSLELVASIYNALEHVKDKK